MVLISNKNHNVLVPVAWQQKAEDNACASNVQLFAPICNIESEWAIGSHVRVFVALFYN